MARRRSQKYSGAPALPAPRSRLATAWTIRYDRGFAVRPSDEPPDDEPLDDDPDDDDPLDCDGAGDGDEVWRGRSCAVPVAVPPLGCV